MTSNSTTICVGVSKEYTNSDLTSNNTSVHRSIKSLQIQTVTPNSKLIIRVYKVRLDSKQHFSVYKSVTDQYLQSDVLYISHYFCLCIDQNRVCKCMLDIKEYFYLCASQ